MIDYTDIGESAAQQFIKNLQAGNGTHKQLADFIADKFGLGFENYFTEVEGQIVTALIQGGQKPNPVEIRKALDQSGKDYLRSLTKVDRALPTQETIVSWGDALHERYCQWQLSQRLPKDMKPSDALQEKIATLTQVAEKSVTDLITIEVLMETAEESVRLPTGVPSLDRHAEGFIRGGLTIIGGHEGTGKTMLAHQLMLEWVIASGQGAVVVSPDMNAHQIVRRWARRYKDRDDVDIAKLPIVFHPKELVTVNSVERLCQRATARYGQLCCILIDTVEDLDVAMQSKLGNTAALQFIYRMVDQQLSKFGAAVVLTQHTSRDWSKRSNPEPRLTDLRYYGSQTVDMVIMPYIPYKYMDKLSKDDKARHGLDAMPTIEPDDSDMTKRVKEEQIIKLRQNAQIFITKNRDGNDLCATMLGEVSFVPQRGLWRVNKQD